MTDLAVIILVGREKLHIRRCLERLNPLEPRQIFVVESQPSDGTHEIAVEMRAETAFNEWPGLYAKQFNWALDNLPIKASWILRLDADEYLYPDTIEELKGLLPQWDGEKVTAGGLPPDVTSLSLSLSRVFCGRKIRFGGTAHIPMVRFFKYGVGRCQDRAMDEHIVTSEGRDYRLKGEFADDNLNTMDWWREKHRGYAKREAVDAIAGEKFKTSKTWYYRFPPYIRAFLYFSYRYFLRLGFLDGYAGWMWHFWQGLWYRCLVDKEIGNLKRSLVIDVEKLIDGDIVLTNEGWSVLSLLVRFFTLSRYSHASLFVGGFIFDSTGDGVFCDEVRRLVKYSDRQVSIYRLKNGLSYEEKKALEEFSRSSTGKSYSIPGALTVGVWKWFRPWRTNTSKEYCSRFVAQAYKSIGKELVVNSNYCTPRALSKSKKLYRVADCYRIRNAGDEIVLGLENRTLENRRHLKSWLDEVKSIPLAHKENVATENDAYEFVSRHREYDMQIAQIILKSGFLEDYKVFFDRYAFKLSVSGLYAKVGGTGYLSFFQNEVSDIQKGCRFASNLKVCECNYLVSRLEVMRLMRDLYYKLTYILFMRLVVLERVTKAQGITEEENADLQTVVKLRDSLKKLLRSVSVDSSIFSETEQLYMSEAEALLQNL